MLDQLLIDYYDTSSSTPTTSLSYTHIIYISTLSGLSPSPLTVQFELNRISFSFNSSLARDSKHDLEKEQALRLIRRILELVSPSDQPENRSKLVAILRGVVAIAEQPEEKLKLSALETLGELGQSLLYLKNISR